MEKRNFMDGWLFAKKGQPLQPVCLPHDAMQTEERKKGNSSGSGAAFYSGNCYLYQKVFSIETEIAMLRFEGVYPSATVWIDGQEAGSHCYGYTDFDLDISAWADGCNHTLLLEVDNSQLPNSRWYSGAGIYRPVWLMTGRKAHIAPDGIRITTLSHDPARIHIETVHNDGSVQIEILDDSAVIVSAAGDSITLDIPGAKLWSAEHPHLYTCRAILTENGQVVDEAACRFGIRSLSWSTDGFFVNGRSVKLQGCCMHHDNGILGARTYRESEFRRVRKLKEFGFNAIRSSHQPMCRYLLEACDELGMYVMDEAWDMWYDHKNPYDYAGYFMEHWQEDLSAMISKDYSHPSVVMYSIGNEVTEPVKPEGVEMTGKLVAACHQLDATRPVTAGINPTLLLMADMNIHITSDAEASETRKADSTAFNKQMEESGMRMMLASATPRADEISAPSLDQLDIVGYNYATPRYESDAQQHPGRILVGSETYPQELPKNWALVKKLPYLIGDFMWTAWDYLGEVGIGSWNYCTDGISFQKTYPWLLADVGVIDILGHDNAEAGWTAAVWGALKKPYIGVVPVNHDPADLYKAIWRGTNARPSWAWQGCEGREAKVEVYTDAAQVELFVNGASLGKKPVQEYRAVFHTTYQPGELKAVAIDAQGNLLSESSLNSAEGRLTIRMMPEGQPETGKPLYLSIDIVGANGVIESNHDTTLSISVEGAELLAFGSANPRTEERFDACCYTTWYGQSQAVLLPGNEKTVTVHVQGDGVPAASLVLEIVQCTMEGTIHE